MKLFYTLGAFLLGTLFVGVVYAATPPITIPAGGTGWGLFTNGAIPYGNSGSTLRFATTTSAASDIGKILSFQSGIPTWVATTTFSSGLTYTGGNVTNTGVTSITATSPLSRDSATGGVTLSISTAGTWSGNAGTATALAANGTNCSAGNYPLGVDASGNVENCTAASGGGGGSGNVSTSTGETAGQLAYWTSTNATPALLGKVATGTISGAGGVTVTAGQSVIGSGLTITCTGASSGAAGCLAAADWSIFNNKISSSSLSSANTLLTYSSASGVFTASTSPTFTNATAARLVANTLIGVGDLSSTNSTILEPETASGGRLALRSNGDNAYAGLDADFIELGGFTSRSAFFWSNGGAPYFNFANSGVYGWSDGAAGSIGTNQTGISRLAAATVAIGNGTAGDFTGTLALSKLGAGTTTPVWPVTAYANSAPQLSLSAGAGIAQWLLSNEGGNLYIGTSTIAGTATSTNTNGLVISNTGVVTIPNLNAAACDVKANTSGVLSCGTDATGGGGGSYPFTLAGNATSTLTQFNGGLTAYASSTIGNGTASGGLTISGDATTTGLAHFKVPGTTGEITIDGTYNTISMLNTAGNIISYGCNLQIGTDNVFNLWSFCTNTFDAPGVFTTTFNAISARYYTADVDAGKFIFQGQSAWDASTNRNGGDLYLAGGLPSGSGIGGNVIIGVDTTHAIGRVGVATTTPWAKFALTGTTGQTNPLFQIASSTDSPYFTVTNTGYFGIGTTSPFAPFSLDRTGGQASSSILVNAYRYGGSNLATSTSQTIDCTLSNTIHWPLGLSATTLTLKGLAPGMTCKVIVENPNGTAGTLTWAATSPYVLRWAGGTAPTQTTTKNSIDVYSFIGAQGSSTPVILGAGSVNF